MASSRVGTRTRPRGGAFAEPDGLASLLIMGRPKARVLPEPVRPRPSTSRPESASGMVAAWIGNGLLMPSASSAATRFAGTPSSAKPRGAASAVEKVWGAGNTACCDG